MLCVLYFHCVAHLLLSFFLLVGMTSDASLIRAGLMVTKRQEWDSGVISISPALQSPKLVSTKLITHTSVSPYYGTSTILPTGRPSFSTTKNHLQPQPRLEHSNQSILPIVFIALGLTALVIVLIMGIYLMHKRLKKLRRERAPAENDYQHQVDCNILVESASSVEADPEDDDIYHDDIALSSPLNQDKIINPVYATVEFLPRCSVAEDYANTFRIAGFLEGDPIIYAEIEIPNNANL